MKEIPDDPTITTIAELMEALSALPPSNEIRVTLSQSSPAVAELRTTDEDYQEYVHAIIQSEL